MEDKNKRILDSLSDEELYQYLDDRGLIVSNIMEVSPDEIVRITKRVIVDMEKVDGLELPVYKTLNKCTFTSHNQSSLCQLKGTVRRCTSYDD